MVCRDSVWRLYPRGELRQAVAASGRMSRLSVITRRDQEQVDNPSHRLNKAWPPTTSITNRLRELSSKRAEMRRVEEGAGTARRF